MNAIEKLTYFTTQLLDKSSADKKPVSAVLEPLMPKVIEGLSDVISCPESSPAQRLGACELLLLTWQRCVKVEIQSERTKAIRAKSKAQIEAARAEKMRVRLEGKQADIKIAAKRRRMQRTLDRATKQLEAGQAGQTEETQ